MRPLISRPGSSGGPDATPASTAALPGAAGPPLAGLAGQAVVLALLSATVGLGAAGWLVGTGYALVTWVLLARAAGRGWGPADTVTLTRATLAGGVAALVADSFHRPVPVAVLVALAAVALLLDAVDGPVARRTDTASPFGARFDMEIDAFLALVLSVFVAGSLGWWVLAVGAPRYAFAAVTRGLPWLRRPLPPRRSRKAVAALQGVVLVVTSAGALPAPVVSAALGLVLTLLGWSFGRDVRWLWRRQQAVARQAVALQREMVLP